MAIYMHNEPEFVNLMIWSRLQGDSANEITLYDREGLSKRAVICHIRPPFPEFCTLLCIEHPFKC
jgi:hypothetical protein